MDRISHRLWLRLTSVVLVINAVLVATDHRRNAWRPVEREMEIR